MIRHLFSRKPDPESVPVEPLTPELAVRLRLSPFSRFTPETLAEHVRRFPGLSWAIPASRSYAVGGYWRLRREIGEVVELSPGPWRHLLLDRLIEGFRAAGMRLVVLDHEEREHETAFYASKGFQRIERIVEYERRNTAEIPATRVRPIRPFEPEDLDRILDVEHHSFPWLWWNSREDLQRYVADPHVTVLVDSDDDELNGYAGFTARNGGGYLDRLAVRESRQGEGIGAALLAAALRQMQVRGVRYVGLSTQENNERSQKLYTRFGFRRTHWFHEIHGLWLTAPEETDR